MSENQKTYRGEDKNMAVRCMGCMETYSEEFKVCPYCGYMRDSQPEQPFHIKPGIVLADRYLIGKAIGWGGFGVTYLAWDIKLEKKVAIKEYLPGEFCTRVPGESELTIFDKERREQFESGKDEFFKEAKRLMTLQKEAEIVSVYDVFEDNNTVYIVMEYLDGITLKEYLKQNGPMKAEEAVSVILPVIEALRKAHKINLIHRDIAPDNIFLLKDGKVKLIDFGAARFATTKHSRSLSVILKPGYAPPEQYRSNGDQGPWTDVYAVCATLYRMITGTVPEEAPDRTIEDKLKEPSKLAPYPVPDNVENAIINGLNVMVEYRTPSMDKLREELMSDSVTRVWVKPKREDTGRWPRWMKAAVAVGVTAGISCLILAMVWVWNAVVHSAYDPIVVPNLCGKEISVAREQAESQGFIMTENEKKYDDVIPSGYILSQDKEPGKTGEDGNVIFVTVSAGRENIYMPDVCGLKQEEAEEQLKTLGFVVSIRTSNVSYTAPGYVESQDLDEGNAYHKGQEVILTVSEGRTDWDTGKEAEVPELTGMSYEEAKQTAGKAGFYVYKADRVYSNDQEKGTVMKQDPERGRGMQGDIIGLTVSLGPEMIRVPDVQLLSEEEARRILTEAGFKVEVAEEDVGTDVTAGHVIRQDMAAESELVKGSKVTIYVNRPENEEEVMTAPESTGVYSETEAETGQESQTPVRQPSSSESDPEEHVSAPTTAAQAENPTEPTKQPQAVTQYRKRTRSRFDSTTKMNGMEEYQTPTVNTSYGEWSGWTEEARTESSTVDVETRQEQYQAVVGKEYNYYCYTYWRNGEQWYTYDEWGANYYGNGNYQYLERGWGEELALNTDYGGGHWGTSNQTGGTIWFYLGQRDKTETRTRTLYRWRAINTTTTYHYYSNWGSWSQWQNTPISGSDLVQVETRTVYQ